MWIILRIIIAISALTYRVLFRCQPKYCDLTFEGLRYSLTTKKTKKRVTGYVLETELTAPFVCRFIREGALEKLLVAMGIGEEIQTGDAEFDQTIFIVGDHPLIAEYVYQRSELRLLLTHHIGAEIKSVSITGTSLRLELKAEADVPESLPLLAAVFSQFKELSSVVGSRFNDRFYRRALVAEGMVMAVLAYAGGAYLELVLFKENHHLYPMTLIRPGVCVGLVLLGFAVLLLGAFLGRSSRAPRIFIECSVLLLIALPAVGIQIISDLNRGLDSSDPTEVVMPVAGTEKKYHHQRRGGYYTYELQFDSARASDQGLPDRMLVSSEVFKHASDSRQVNLIISQGFLGYPWYQEVYSD